MTKDMTTGSSLKLILFFTIPVVLGNLFQQFYNMVDAIIVGQYLGADALAAVGSTASLTFLVLGFANGIAQGFGIMISHAFGAKDIKQLRHYVALSLILTCMISALLTIPTVAASRLVLIYMNTPSNILEMTDSYLKIIFAGIIFTMSYNVAAGILRGIGDSKTPLFFLIFSSVLNIGLDIFFIVTAKMGTSGAAWATIIAQGISALLCFIYMFSRFDILRTGKDDYYIDFIGIKNMLSVGIPMALNYSVTAMGCAVLQASVNVFGSSVVAAFAAANKVFNIAMQPALSLGTTMSTFCGQNLGAQKNERIFKGMKQAFFVGFFIAALACVICCIFGRYIVSWFVHNPSQEIMYYAMHYLNIVSWFMIPLTWIFLYRNALQGLGKGFVPMMSGLIELTCRYLVILVFAKTFGYTAVCFADPITWIATAIPLMLTYFHWKNKIIRTNPQLSQVHREDSL